MRKKSLVFPLVIICSLVIFASCQKEGSAGAAGPAGPAGPQGPQGPKGDSGAANVIYSDWIDVTFEPANADSSNWSAAIRVERLDNEMLSQGEIKVYVNVNTSADPVVFPLPYFDGQTIINPVFYTDTIALVATTDVSTGTQGSDKVLQYRYVLIPGGALALKPDNINLDNYADVKKYLKLAN
jgi:hypothetical protein